MGQDRANMDPRSAKMEQDGANMGPRWAQTGPRRSQQGQFYLHVYVVFAAMDSDDAKLSQDSSKMGQEGLQELFCTCFRAFGWSPVDSNLLTARRDEAMGRLREWINPPP